MRPRLIAAPVAAAALAFAGCAAAPQNDAASEFSGEEAQVAEVIDDLSAAAAGREAGEVCDTIFAADLREQLGSGGAQCEDAVEDQLLDVSDPEIEVEAIEVQDDTATAQVVTPWAGDDVQQTMTFVREGNAWRLAEVSEPPADAAPAS